MPRAPTRSLAPERGRAGCPGCRPLTGHFIGRVFWDSMDVGSVGKCLFAGKMLARGSACEPARPTRIRVGYGRGPSARSRRPPDARIHGTEQACGQRSSRRLRLVQSGRGSTRLQDARSSRKTSAERRQTRPRPGARRDDVGRPCRRRHGCRRRASATRSLRLFGRPGFTVTAWRRLDRWRLVGPAGR